MRQHRMCRVAEQRQPALGPGRQRLTVVERPAKCLVDLLQHVPDARVPTFELAAQHRWIPGRGPRFLHFLIGRHEADVVDHRAVTNREDQEVPGRTGPHLPAVHRPVRQALARDQTSIGNGAVKDGLRGRKDVGAQFGVDSVGGNHDVGLGGGAVGEFDAGHVAVLLEADGTVAGMDDPGGQVGGEEIDEVGAVHAKGRVPAGGVRHLHRGDRRTVVAKVAGARTDSRAPFLDGGPETHTLQVAHRIRCHEHTSADLAQCGRLFIDRNAQPLSDQRIGGEQAADAASDDHDVWPRCHVNSLEMVQHGIVRARGDADTVIRCSHLVLLPERPRHPLPLHERDDLLPVQHAAARRPGVVLRRHRCAPVPAAPRPGRQLGAVGVHVVELPRARVALHELPSADAHGRVALVLPEHRLAVVAAGVRAEHREQRLAFERRDGVAAEARRVGRAGHVDDGRHDVGQVARRVTHAAALAGDALRPVRDQRRGDAALRGSSACRGGTGCSRGWPRPCRSSGTCSPGRACAPRRCRSAPARRCACACARS